MKPTGGTVVQLDKDKPRNRCRRWELRANFGCVDGKYPHKTKRFEGTWREANAALSEWLAELEYEDEREKAPTFSEYAKRWHERREKSGMLSARTVDREVSRIANAAAAFGGKRIDEVTSEDVENLYTSMLDGSLTGKRLSASTASTMACTLSPLFTDAVKEGMAKANPVRDAKRPKVAQEPRSVPDGGKVDAMLAALDVADPAQRAVSLCAACGLRRSEAVALEWDDFDGSEVRVSKSCADNGKLIPTKNGRIRSVPVPESLAAKLESERDDGGMCPMKPLSLSQWWRRNRARFGMEGVRLHDLRHAYATRLAVAGVHPKVMQSLGGWETMDVCMQIYTHVNDTALFDAVKAAFPGANS